MSVEVPAGDRPLLHRQVLTVALLFGGYASLYFCRADLSVSTPLLVEELGRHGMSHGNFAAAHGRHLRGCYLTRDSVYSTTALLRRALAGAA